MWFGDITEKDISEVQILTRTIRYIRNGCNSNLCWRLQENEIGFFLLMPLLSTDCVVPREVQLLLDVGR